MFDFWKNRDEEERLESVIEDLNDKILEMKWDIEELEEEKKLLKKEKQAMREEIEKLTKERDALKARDLARDGARTRQWENLLDYSGKPQNGASRGYEGDPMDPPDHWNGREEANG